MLANQRPAVTGDPGLTHRHQPDGIRNATTATTATTSETCGLLYCCGVEEEIMRPFVATFSIILIAWSLFAVM